MLSIPRFLCSVVPLAILLSAAGCSPWNLSEPMAWPWKEEKPEIPGRLVAMWTDDVLYHANRSATRGFGGRLMFYNDEQKEPVKVDGTLVVYAFDEDGRKPSDVVPDRKFVFTPEQFSKYYSKSDLGHSYSVWLPWDKPDGPQKEISLIVRFIPAMGPIVVGKQTRHILSGNAVTPELQQAEFTQEMPQQATAGQFVQSASYDVPLSSGPQNGGPMVDSSMPAMTTTTIPIPSRFGRPAPVATMRPEIVPGSPYGMAPAAGIGWSPNPQATNGVQALPPVPPQQLQATWQGPPQPVTPPPRVRFVRPRSRALGEPIARIDRDHGSSQPYPATSPYYPPSPPTPATGFGYAPPAGTAAPASYQWQ